MQRGGSQYPVIYYLIEGNTHVQAKSEQSSFARGHMPKVQGALLPYSLDGAVEFGTSVGAYRNGSTIYQPNGVTFLQQLPLYDQHPSDLLGDHAQSTPP